MTNLDIETFWAVVQHGTMTAAAEALYITQPTLSMRIRALEERVGLRICNFVQPPPDRVSILVTRAGEELSEYGKIFLQELGESIRGVKDVQIYL